MRIALLPLSALFFPPLFATAQTSAAKINIAVTIIWVPRSARVSPNEFVVGGKPRHDLARYFAVGMKAHTTYPVTAGPHSTTTNGQSSGSDLGTFVPGALLGDARGLVSFNSDMNQTSHLVPGNSVRVAITLRESKLLPAEPSTRRRFIKTLGFLETTATIHNGSTQYLG